MYSMAYHKPEHLVRLKWLAGSAGMTDEDFKETLEAFADTAIQHKAKRLLIDVLEFKHRPAPEVMAWRDEVVVPKYNRAGVKKIAWVWPGKTPSNQPTSEKDKFENRYFPTEAEALAWVAF
jgi:tagatose-1,6-bisphosphate aldolase non-catalytic subunit AgaZ/GatZ